MAEVKFSKKTLKLKDCCALLKNAPVKTRKCAGKNAIQNAGFDILGTKMWMWSQK